VFKLESLQHAGSFKSRGAFTNLLTRTVPAAGVGAASGGNRGAAVAFAAGAAALAALTSGRYAPAPDERIAVLICGGNSTAVDFER